jgi:hypothetical protein
MMILIHCVSAPEGWYVVIYCSAGVLAGNRVHRSEDEVAGKEHFIGHLQLGRGFCETRILAKLAWGN